MFLLGSQVLPGLHAIENAVLLLRGQAAEMLQPLPQLLLPLRRKPLKLRIILEGIGLLTGREIFVAP